MPLMKIKLKRDEHGNRIVDPSDPMAALLLTVLGGIAISDVLNSAKEPTMTKGEYRAGIRFNPSNNPTVDMIKKQAALLIDMIETIPKPEDATDVQKGEIARLKALAQTAIEEGAMWAEKAATKGPQE